MKKIVLLFIMLMTFSLLGCNAQQEEEIPVEDILEMSSAEEDVSEEVSEAASEVSEMVYSEPEEEEVSEENAEESESAEDAEFLKGLSVHTMWIHEMTAKEAVLSSIWSGDYSDNTKAMVVGLLLQTADDGNHISSMNTVQWCTMENEEYVILEESTSSGTAPICGDELAVVIGRFPADKVDVNNLYLEISDFSGDTKKYYKVEPDNLFDIYSLEASETVTGEPGEIVYFHDIPFIITAAPWQSDVLPWDYDMTNYTQRDEPCIDNDRTITLMPLTGQLSYDFSFYQTVKLSENCDSENYAVTYTTRWEDESMLGTIEGNCVNLSFRYMWYYAQAEMEAYEKENPDDYYASGFYDAQEEEMRASDLLDTYLEMENSNRPATKLYFLQ